jgi:hypothetical protein
MIKLIGRADLQCNFFKRSTLTIKGLIVLMKPLFFN